MSKIDTERFRLRRQIRVHTAQGRLTGWILAIMPLLLGFAFYLVNPGTIGEPRAFDRRASYMVLDLARRNAVLHYVEYDTSLIRRFA